MFKAGSTRSSVVSGYNHPPTTVTHSSCDPAERVPNHCYVDVPILSATQKEEYKHVRDFSLLPKIDEVIGEYERNGSLYYYARFNGGIAHRYTADGFSDYFSNLLEVYNDKKANDQLLEFDPNASYVHPLHRADKFSLPSSRAMSSSPSFSALSSLSNSDEEYDNESVASTRRRSSRHKKALPFSPRKTRRVVLTLRNSDDETDDVPVGRTLRYRQLKLKPMYDDDDDDDESEFSDDYHYSRRRKSKGKSKAAPKRKGVRPEYGSVRPIADIELDYFSDDDDKPLRAHRAICEKCHQGPAHQLMAALTKRKGRKKKPTSEDEFDNEEDRIGRLGGWVRCLKCPVAAHWGCMAQTQRDEVLKAIRERDNAKWQEENDEEGSEPPKRKELKRDETTDFICGPCSRGGICMGCMETVLEPVTDVPAKTDGDVEMAMVDGNETPKKKDKVTPARSLLYRCLTCKRLAHYAHLRPPSDLIDAGVADIAEHYQKNTSWLCSDCYSYRYPLDKIIAWRPYPPNAVEPPRPPNTPPAYKERLPREYLVKWQDRSYRRLTWVPHMWLVSTNASKLKNFLSGGTKVDLLEEPIEEGDEQKDKDKEEAPTFEVAANESRDSSAKPGTSSPKLPNDSMPDAEKRIPPAWTTTDRILDVVFWAPKPKKESKNKSKGKKRIVTSDEDNEEDKDDEEDEDEETVKELRELVGEEGDITSIPDRETAEEWEARTGQTITMNQIKRVVFAFIKWDDLGYDEASWDSPPEVGEKGYEAYENAFKRYVFSRTVEIPKLSAAHAQKFDDRVKDEFRKKYLLKDAAKLQLGQAPGLKLMPFQVDGFNWLCDNWWNHQHCILADEMGLGKTVQVTAFLGFIASKWNALPALVVVPNSTITNWVREFERWAPNLRVVPFYGEKKARDIIKKYELFHDAYHSSNTSAKFHVLVTTYENITGRDFTTVFKKQNRWEVLVVDEGQRLKSDSSLLFRKLNELNTIHRVIMTGTPLNNNIRELFNLMNFLDPKEWSNLEELEREYSELDEESIKTLHARLRPYFLRRIKSEVLQLPAKNEVIVPVSMAPLQKEVYRSILSHNLDVLNGLSTSRSFGAVSKGKLNNVLMHLRKCLQHPYLYSESIEPKGLSEKDTHDKLIDASSKLRFLKALLPKLRERGHRVLLFSQFVIALDVIEDFLNGEGFKYLRLDGSTKGTERQKGMDEFNRPGSDVFVYLLTTRAGGVGINLFSADTVIIFDPDFNPHQDLQAIARAYRYGQKKTCLVFKLMVKDSAEERIMQIGKKKLVLDHLIVQKMDDDEDGAGENIQSILTYGAQALFDEGKSTRDIIYSDHDISNLIEKTEVEGEEEDKPKEGGGFSFAKIWAADKDALEEVEDNDQADSWAQTLQMITAEREKEVIQSQATEPARGRRKAAALAKTKMIVDESTMDVLNSVKKGKKKKISKSNISASGSAYSVSDGEESPDESDGDIVMRDSLAELHHQHSVERPRVHAEKYSSEFTITPRPNASMRPLSPIYPECGLCGERHGDGYGECTMTDSSANLAEFREMLILNAGDEDWETRSAAIRAIDDMLHKRGHLSLIAGQPLHPLKVPPPQTIPVVTDRRAPQPPQPQPQPQPPQPTRVVANPRPAVPPPPQPINGTQRQPIYVPQATGQPRQVVINNAAPVAGPSKRPSSPTMTMEPKKKKKRKQLPSDISCQVCGGPVHLLKDCPRVQEGSQSISQQIQRLEGNPTKVHVVDILRKLLKKAKLREVRLEVP